MCGWITEDENVYYLGKYAAISFAAYAGYISMGLRCLESI